MSRTTGSRGDRVLLGGIGLALAAWVGAAQTVSDPATKEGGRDSAPALPENLSAADWAGIRAAYEAGRYAMQPFGSGYRAHNRGQRWTTCFDGRGFVTIPDGGAWTWGLQLVRYGWGELDREIDEAEAPRCVQSEGARLVYEWDERLEEWYVNDARGFEHGFTVQDRPAGANGELTLELGVSGDLEPMVDVGGRGVTFFNDARRKVLTYSSLAVFDADSNSLDANFERVGGRLVLRIEDQQAHYPLTIDPVAQQCYLKASNTGALDTFGNAVAISGDTVVVGAPLEDSAATGVNGDQSDNGAPDSGAAYVFVRNGASWSQEAYLKATNTGAGDMFGYSVAISGDTIVVGAIYEDSGSPGVNGDGTDNSAMNSGAAYVYVRNGATWSRQAYLKAHNPGGAFPGDEEGDVFGYSVSISGNSIVVGAPQQDGSGVTSGAVYIFQRNGVIWSQQGYVKGSNTETGDYFGGAVAISGDTLVAGALVEDSHATGVGGDENDNSASGSGAAYVFVRNGGIWSQQAYLKASNTESADLFGCAVAISGDTLVVGAYWESSSATGVDGDQSNNGANKSGAAYVFARNGSTWSQQAYLKASNTGVSDEFGYAVSISDNAVVVGAPREDSSGRGVNADQGNDDAPSSGAAYAFTRTGTSWIPLAYLKASNADPSDGFGVSVAISEDTSVVGAGGESSNATGPNGNQNNNTSFVSGAAYVFVLIPEPTALCSGDGSGAPCPCGNAGGPGRGCANSTGAGGLLVATGSAYIHAHDLVLSGTGLVPNQPGLYFQGEQSLGGGSGIPFGDGLRCAGGAAIRLETRMSDPSGASSTTLDLAAEGRVHPGDTRFYQLYYRDTASSPCGGAFNFTNALRVSWVL